MLIGDKLKVEIMFESYRFNKYFDQDKLFPYMSFFGQ